MNKVVSTRYLVLFVAMVAMGFLLVGSVGYYAGPAHFASKHYEEGMADILLSGSNVGFPGLYDVGDEGKFQKYYVSRLRDREEVIVMGSSRSMQVTASLFPGRSFFNSSVTAAGLGDLFATYELYEQRGLSPSVVVLGLDPWMLDGSYAEQSWTSLREEYLSMAKQLNLVPSSAPIGIRNNVIRELLSLKYFKQAAANLVLSRNRVGYFATDNRSYDGTLKACDGSLSWALGYRTASSDYVEALAIEWARSISDPAELSKERMSSLEAFVDYLHSENVEVIFFLPPFHPSAYEILVQEDPAILQAEAYYRNLARDRGIPVVGSYDPQQCSCTKEDFFDGEHPTESGVDKVFSSLDCMPPSKCHTVE